MKDSIEIDPLPQTSTEIKNLKTNLVNTKKTNNNNSLTTDDKILITQALHFTKQKNSEHQLQKQIKN